MNIEQNTNYAYKLKQLDNPSFENVMDLSVEFYHSLPQDIQDEMLDALKRGVDILDREPLMLTYTFSYGKMQQDIFGHAFCCLPDRFLEQDAINIIDYGCGQAWGTICYGDYLRNNGYDQRIKSITLIDPSDICLKRAALHASVFFPDAEIKTVNKKFDDLTNEDIIYSNDIPTFNVFSNVQDLLNFDLDRFANLVKRCIKGYNFFVCLESFPDTRKEKRLERLVSILKGECSCQEAWYRYEQYCKNDLNCLVRVFPIGDFPMLQTNEEIAADFKELFYHQYGLPLPDNYELAVINNKKEYSELTTVIIRYLEEGFVWKCPNHKDILSYCIQPLRFGLDNIEKKDIELTVNDDIVGVLVNKQEHIFIVVASRKAS